MKFPLKIIKITGKSMEPKLFEGDYILLKRTQQVKVNDIIVFQKHNIIMVKRIKEINNAGIFVIGDNLLQSTDSRHFGYIKNSQIIGKMLIKF